MEKIKNNSLMKAFSLQFEKCLQINIPIASGLDVDFSTTNEETEFLHVNEVLIKNAVHWLYQKEPKHLTKQAELLPALFEDDEARIRFGLGEHALDIVFVNTLPHSKTFFLSSLFIHIQHITDEFNQDIQVITTQLEQLSKTYSHEMEDGILIKLHQLFLKVFHTVSGLGYTVLEELLPANSYLINVSSLSEINVEQLKIYDLPPQNTLTLFQIVPSSELHVIHCVFEERFLLSFDFYDGLKQGTDTMLKVSISRIDHQKTTFSIADVT